MSLTRKTYSPMSHSYSYSSTVTPAYSYSRVSTYLDALERDQQINKLKRQLTTAKSLDMKYYSLLQEISLAEKENRMLQSKNQNIEQDYVLKVQSARKETAKIEEQLHMINLRLTEEETKVQSVEKDIQQLLEELKELKLQEESLEQQNTQLQSQVNACNSHLSKLTEERTQLSTQKSTLCTETRQCTQQMQQSLTNLTQLEQKITKYTQQLSLLQGQSESFTLECQNMQTLCAKNMTMILNLERKVSIQEGENQQLKNQLSAVQQEWESLQNKFTAEKESLYQNVIKVEEQGLVLKQTLDELDKLLETDSTQKKYLKDVSSKHAMLSGQNEEMRQLVRHLQETYNQKKAKQTSLVQEINRRLKTDEMVKCAIDQRTQQLTKLRVKYVN